MRLEIKTESRLHSAQTYGYWGKGVWDRHVHTAIFKVDSQQGPTVEHRELCSVLCGSLDGREFEGERIHVYVMLSLFAVHLKLSRHC